MTDYKMERFYWVFKYRVTEVLEAAQTMVSHHQDRLAWWEKEMAAAEVKLKAKGFEYREEANSMRRDVVIVGDPQLAHRVVACKQKVDQHRDDLHTYEAWSRAIEAKKRKDPNGDLELKFDDIIFFGL